MSVFGENVLPPNPNILKGYVCTLESRSRKPIKDRVKERRRFGVYAGLQRVLIGKYVVTLVS